MESDEGRFRKRALSRRLVSEKWRAVGSSLSPALHRKLLRCKGIRTCKEYHVEQKNFVWREASEKVGAAFDSLYYVIEIPEALVRLRAICRNPRSAFLDIGASRSVIGRFQTRKIFSTIGERLDLQPLRRSSLASQ